MAATHITSRGTPVWILTEDGGGDHPLIGGWYNVVEDCWIPAAWTKDGFLVSADQPSSLDIQKVK